MKYFLLLCLSLSLSAQVRWDATSQATHDNYLINRLVPNLSLAIKNEKLIHPKSITVLAAFDSDCPLSKKIAPSFRRLQLKYKDESVRFIHLSVNAADSLEKVKETFRERAFVGELCFDESKKVASALKLRTTCEVLLIDSKGTLIYRGAVNDQYGIGFSRNEAKNHFLDKAISASLKNAFPQVRMTSAPGCLLEHSKVAPLKQSISFHNQVSRILQKRCQECHRDGGSGPFKLISYADVSERKKMIKYVVQKKLMPPWFAEKGGPWLNDCSLSKIEEENILEWIANNCPEGNKLEAPLPLKWSSKWKLKNPDYVLTLPQPIKVSAEGQMPYVNVYVQVALDKDQWISAMEIRSEQSQVLHHVLIMDDPTGSKRLNKKAFGGGVQGFLGGLVPGQSLTEYPVGMGKRLKAGSWLKFQLHYTPNGKAVEDTISLALKFLDKEPTRQMRTVSAFNARFVIPPHEAHHVVKAQYRFPVDATVLTFAPHTHLRGKSFKYELILPDGTKKTVLDIPHYDFNWQLRYMLKEPLKVPRGARMVCTAVYDNSANNPANPNPNQKVRFGDQTDDEMMIGYFEGYIGH